MSVCTRKVIFIFFKKHKKIIKTISINLDFILLGPIHSPIVLPIKTHSPKSPIRQRKRVIASFIVNITVDVENYNSKKIIKIYCRNSPFGTALSTNLCMKLWGRKTCILLTIYVHTYSVTIYLSSLFSIYLSIHSLSYIYEKCQCLVRRGSLRTDNLFASNSLRFYFLLYLVNL